MDDVISSPIIVYIPAIGCADWEFEVQVKHGLSVCVDRDVELFITQTSGMAVCFVIVSIEALGSNSDSVDGRFILLGVRVKFFNIGIERLSPVTYVSARFGRQVMAEKS